MGMDTRVRIRGAGGGGVCEFSLPPQLTENVRYSCQSWEIGRGAGIEEEDKMRLKCLYDQDASFTIMIH